MDRDRILLTPGPLTTTLRTKLAMLKDWGSWDADFNAVTASVRSRLLDIVNGQDSHVVVPLQGSGTFSVEAAVATVVPRDGHVLVPDNGAYCKRAAKLSQMMGRKATVMPVPEDRPVDAAAVEAQLKADSSITHVILIHCETGTGVENPLAAVAAVCARHGLRLHPQGHPGRLRRQQPELGHGPARPARLHGQDRAVALYAAHARGGGAV
jgi:2-aminoethylphosphonate-pyruvate transaminase